MMFALFKIENCPFCEVSYPAPEVARELPDKMSIQACKIVEILNHI
jgi:hypothetical protein